jgi:chemotaxis protein MotB
MAEHRPPPRRRVRHEEEHHGGAWKVAYADLVTAMMAFFLVMWLISTGPEVKENVARYFSDPIGFAEKAAAGSGMMDGSPTLDEDQNPTEGEPDPEAVLRMKALEIQKALRNLENFKDIEDQIFVELGPEGLRIQLQEAGDSTFFGLGSPAMSGRGKAAISAIGNVVSSMPYELTVEGHTDSQQFRAGSGYGNWELSADRANAARRLLESSGVATARIHAIHGYADTKPHYRESSTDPRNRRIEILVLNPDYVEGG